MDRSSSILRGCPWLVFATVLVVSAWGATTSPQPNIILVVSDDHGLDAMGAYGNPVIKTPNMDKLAAEGVRFIAPVRAVRRVVR